MKNKIQFDSDELFDTTSADSGEEYIPKPSEDSDTDKSITLDSIYQKNCINSDIRKCVSQSLNILKNQTGARKSRSKTRSTAVRQKRQRLTSIQGSSPQRCRGNSSNESGSDTEGFLENSKQHLPDGSSSVVKRTAESSLTILAVPKKENGSRMYDKKQYCLYCKLGVGKMARHLERAHKDKPEVAQAMSFPKGSKERRMHLEHLRNKGNFAHNVNVLNTGSGKLVPCKQPQQETQAQDFLHCVYCQGFFQKKILWRHVLTCKFKPCDRQKPGKSRVQALCSFALPPPPGVKKDLWRLLHNMVQDDIFAVVKTDACILEYGEHLYNRLGYDAGKHEYIRQKMRELGRLLVCSRKNTALKSIEDHIRPANFMKVVEGVKNVAGYNSETNTYRRPSLALKIGHSLVKISLLVESRANVQSNFTAAKEARTFRRI